MTGVPIQQMANRVAELLEKKLGIRGDGLSGKVPRAGRRLPRRVSQAAQQLSQAAAMAQNPKLLLQIDQEATAKAYDICVRYLSPLDGASRRKGALLNMAASVGFSLLTVAVIVVAVLMWRHLI